MKIDQLAIEIYPDRLTMGFAAASAVADRIRIVLDEQEELRIIFAAAPSQNEMLNSLAKYSHLQWKRIIAFHMDEYIELSEKAPQRFGNFLKDRIFDKVPFKQVHYLSPSRSNAQEECDRYARLISEAPIDIICMGIGENGHIAFNDPPVAQFNDPKLVKIVQLDPVCRQQQVNDGCFPSLAEVPEHAITLTVPVLMSGKYLSVVVPGKAKAEAVKCMLFNPISEKCPASVLRHHENAHLFLDEDSGVSVKE